MELTDVDVSSRQDARMAPDQLARRLLVSASPRGNQRRVERWGGDRLRLGHMGRCLDAGDGGILRVEGLAGPYAG